METSYNISKNMLTDNSTFTQIGSMIPNYYTASNNSTTVTSGYLGISSYNNPNQYYIYSSDKTSGKPITPLTGQTIWTVQPAQTIPETAPWNPGPDIDKYWQEHEQNQKSFSEQMEEYLKKNKQTEEYFEPVKEKSTKETKKHKKNKKSRFQLIQPDTEI